MKRAHGSHRTMSAVVVRDGACALVRDWPVPKPCSDEVLIKVVATAETRTNVLILTRLQHEALKMLYPQVVKHMSVAPRARVRASSPFHARASLTGFWSPGIRSWTRNS